MTEIFSPKDLSGNPIPNVVVAGQVVGVHIDDSVLTDGHFDAVKAGNVARLGYLDYLIVESVFARRRPKWEE